MVNIIPIDEAQVDMIIARDIVSSQGQVLAKRGTVLDEQLWMHLQFYGIDQIAVEPEDVPSAPNYNVTVTAYDFYDNPKFRFLFEDICKRDNLDNNYIDLNYMDHRCSPLLHLN